MHAQIWYKLNFASNIYNKCRCNDQIKIITKYKTYALWTLFTLFIISIIEVEFYYWFVALIDVWYHLL